MNQSIFGRIERLEAQLTPAPSPHASTAWSPEYTAAFEEAFRGYAVARLNEMSEGNRHELLAKMASEVSA